MEVVGAPQSQARARVHAFARLKETLMKRSHCVDGEEIDGGKMLDAPKNKAAAATSSVSNYLRVRRRENPLNNHHHPLRIDPHAHTHACTCMH